MIQDIAPHTFNNEYTPSAPKDSDYVIVVDDRRILLKQHAGGRLMLPTVSDLLRDSDLLSSPAESASEAAAAPTSVPDHSASDEVASDSLSQTLTYLFSIDETCFFFLPETPAARAPYQYVNEMVSASWSMIIFHLVPRPPSSWRSGTRSTISAENAVSRRSIQQQSVPSSVRSAAIFTTLGFHRS